MNPQKDISKEETEILNTTSVPDLESVNMNDAEWEQFLASEKGFNHYL